LTTLAIAEPVALVGVACGPVAKPTVCADARLVDSMSAAAAAAIRIVCMVSSPVGAGVDPRAGVSSPDCCFLETIGERRTA
jgi:hypothetical protein